ncbi:non-ribosomal peptide synthetase [Plantactinospora sonchi]|uniref:Amino acid adenylation domain-containing protein n=1 Tax=Plantactinospora sonchi TaxID=1544735 RepID=A0ABU7RWP0_9ACTN
MTRATRARPDHDTGAGAAVQPGAGVLSRKEEALWLFQRLAPRAAVDNLAFAVSTSGSLDPVTLAAAVRELARRHPVLRTVFPVGADGTPYRRRLAADEVVPPVLTVSSTPAGLGDTLATVTRRPFDLTAEPPFRVARVVLPDSTTVLCLVVHHIAFDGRSAGIALPELATIYLELAGRTGSADGTPDGGTGSTGGTPGDEQTSPPATPSATSLRYWTERLAGIDPRSLPLGRARPEPPAPTFAGARIERQLGAESRAALDVLRRRLRVTDNMVLLTAYLALLARHGAGPDLVVAVPVDTRDRAAAGLVGYHVNTLPLRVTVPPGASFRELATEVRAQLVAGLDHADVSFESLLGALGLETMNWRAPLFRHMFNFLPATTVVPAGPLPDAAWVTVDPGLSRYDLQMVVLRWPDRIALQAVYSTEIHDAGYVRALLNRYELLLRAAATDPDRPLGDLDLWHPDERAALDRENGPAGADTPPLPRLIAERAGRTPGAPALVEATGEGRDHAWLAARAALLRGRLAAAGVGPGDVVAVALPRGGDLAAAVLATWSLRAAYLPVDPGQPAARLRARLDAADVRAVLTGTDLPAEGTADRRVLRVDRLTPDPLATAGPTGTPAGTEPEPAGALSDALCQVRDDDLAYVIFTSGSTGEPKGVEISHGALANLVGFFAHRLAVTDRERILWLTSFGFDISALELFLALSHGGAAVVAPDQAQFQPELLLDLVTRHDVAIVQTTPTIWRLVAGRLGTELAGRRVLCGGEPLSAALADRLLGSGCRLFNVYGPTETTIWSTVAEIRPGVRDPVGIGGPIWRTTLHVLDDEGRELPPGVVGELWIGGAGVARGYLRRPDLTAERFSDVPGAGRRYRTGDLATWCPDGTVELLGRADRQVKLRGRRIELGEIEAVLEQHPAVAAAAVQVYGDPQSDGRLVGYVQPADASDNLLADVARHAAAVLPHYLVPGELIRLDALPRNPSGKVDHRALPEPSPPSDRAGPVGFDAVARTGAAPDVAVRSVATGTGPAGSTPEAAAPATDPLVRSLTDIWADLLGRPDVDERSNFFAAGGQSLLAAVLAARIAERTGHEVTLHDVFSAPTPYELARIVRDGPDPARAAESDG